MTMKHKTRTERVYNESTGWYETREVELKGYTFTDDDRILIVREYLESCVPAEKNLAPNSKSASRRWFRGVPEHALRTVWLQQTSI